MASTTQTGAKLTSIAPQFLVLNVEAACAFYVEKLGFRIAFTFGGFYAGLQRDGATVHLKHSDEPDPLRHTREQEDHLDAYINVDDVEALYAEYQSRGVTFARPLVATEWGTREFVVRDNDGYILFFGQVI